MCRESSIFSSDNKKTWSRKSCKAIIQFLPGNAELVSPHLFSKLFWTSILLEASAKSRKSDVRKGSETKELEFSVSVRSIPLSAKMRKSDGGD